MNHFYVITNSMKDKELLVTKKIANYLKLNGKTCIIQQEDCNCKREQKTGANYDRISLF